MRPCCVLLDSLRPSTLLFPSSLSSSFSFSWSSSSSMWEIRTLRTLANEESGTVAENNPLTDSKHRMQWWDGQSKGRGAVWWHLEDVHQWDEQVWKQVWRDQRWGKDLRGQEVNARELVELQVQRNDNFIQWNPLRVLATLVVVAKAQYLSGFEPDREARSQRNVTVAGGPGGPIGYGRAPDPCTRTPHHRVQLQEHLRVGRIRINRVAGEPVFQLCTQPP